MFIIWLLPLEETKEKYNLSCYRKNRTFFSFRYLEKCSCTLQNI